MKSKKKVAIVGAGLGGLSAAIRLANSGYDVSIFEKNSFLGGKAHSFFLDNFRFDFGPTLVTMPFVFEELFISINKNIDDYIQFIRPEIICKYFYPDGTVFNSYSDLERLENEFFEKFALSQNSFKKYFQYIKNIYDLSADIFLFSSLTEKETYFNKKAFSTLFKIKELDFFRTVNSANEKLLNNKKAVQFFNRFSTYNGSNPYKAPATLNIIPFVELNFGSLLPKNGIYGIASALEKLCNEMNVKIYNRTEIERIIISDRKVVGIEVDKDRLLFDIVLTNSDTHYTYNELLGQDNSKFSAAEKLSSSAIIFYWGVRGEYNKLETHNIIFSDNYKKEFIEIFDQRKTPEQPTIYIYVSSKYNRNDAPSGYENWYVMINSPNNNGQNWDKQIEKTRRSIIKSINNTLNVDIENNIISERIVTPIEIEKLTKSYRGSIYGLSSNSKFSAFLRHQNKSSKISGLYFVGGSYHPGGGMPLVLLSSKIATKLINKYEI